MSKLEKITELQSFLARIVADPPAYLEESSLWGYFLEFPNLLNKDACDLVMGVRAHMRNNNMVLAAQARALFFCVLPEACRKWESVGFTRTDIAGKLSVTPSCLATWLKHLDPHRVYRRYRRGVREDRVRRLRDLKQAGHSYAEIGAMHGISGERVRQLLLIPRTTKPRKPPLKYGSGRDMAHVAMALRKQGRTWNEIANEIGCATSQRACSLVSYYAKQPVKNEKRKLKRIQAPTKEI